MSEKQGKDSKAEESESRIKQIELLHDYLKHLTTLSTGSILVMVTFLEKLFQKPEWTALIGISLVSFMLSVIMCILAQTANVMDIERKEDVLGYIAVTGLLGSWLGFLLGVLSLVVFALKNLY